MSYYKKYLKYKNKYLELSKKSVINMQGGSIPPPWVCAACTMGDNKGPNCDVCLTPRPGPSPGPSPGPRPGPVAIQPSLLQTVITSVDAYASHVYHFPDKQEALKQQLKSIIGREVDCTFIAVRGDGLCLLNATCPVLFCSIQRMSHAQLLYETRGFHNISDAARNIPADHRLNAEITGNCEVSLSQVKQNFISITEQLLRRFGLKLADYDSLDFRPDINPNHPNYPLEQLGQAISTSLSCVIVNINIENGITSCNGIFPDGESLSISDGSMNADTIRENVNTRRWRVVFNISHGRHYTAMIPQLGPDINDSNISLFNMIFDKITNFKK